MTKFLLDSGDPDEYREIAKLAENYGSEIWGSTTNPTLIAKKLAGKKISKKEAFELQKEIVLEILEIVKGAVSAEVYADEKTKALEMTKQGMEITAWDKRVVVKLPTTLEGFKARSELRKNKVPINNTLVFSQQQIFAICLHERIVQKKYSIGDSFPPFISPFVGRLDDQNENGMDLVSNGMKIKEKFKTQTWMLEASVRKAEHIRLGVNMNVELITAPAKIYREWFAMSLEQQKLIDTKTYAQELSRIDYWKPPTELFSITSEEAFFEALNSDKINIQHPLTDKGLVRFADDWKAIITHK